MNSDGSSSDEGTSGTEDEAADSVRGGGLSAGGDSDIVDLRSDSGDETVEGRPLAGSPETSKGPSSAALALDLLQLLLLRVEGEEQATTTATCRRLCELISGGKGPRAAAVAVLASGALAADPGACSSLVALLGSRKVAAVVKIDLLRALGCSPGTQGRNLRVLLGLAGVLPVCLRLLATEIDLRNRDETSLLQNAVRFFLRSVGGESQIDDALRQALHDALWPENPGPAGQGKSVGFAEGVSDKGRNARSAFNDAPTAARLLGALAGRQELLDNTAIYPEVYLISEIVAATQGTLDSIISTVGMFPMCTSQGMAEIVAGLVRHHSSGLMISKGLVPALTSALNWQLAANQADWRLLESLAILSTSEAGQEALWASDTILASLQQAAASSDDSVAHKAIKTISRLCAHQVPREFVANLVSIRSPTLLGTTAILASETGARAAEHAGMLDWLLHSLQPTAGVTPGGPANHPSEAACMCIAGLMEFGTRACKLALVKGGAVAAVMGRLGEDPTDSRSWQALAGLLVMKQGLEEALAHGISGYLSQGLKAGAKASAFFTSVALERICTTEAGIAASLAAGVVEALAAIVNGGSSDNYDMQWLAASWLTALGILAGEKVREAAATSCLRPLLALLDQPWTVPVMFTYEVSDRVCQTLGVEANNISENYRMAEAIVQDLCNCRVGRQMAYAALEELKEDARKADTALLCRLMKPCYHFLAKQGLVMALCQALETIEDQVARISVLQCSLAACRDGTGFTGEMLSAGVLNAMSRLLTPEEPDVAALSAAILRHIAAEPGATEDLMEAGVLARLVDLLKIKPRQAAPAEAARAVDAWLKQAADDGEEDAVAAFASLEVPEILALIIRENSVGIRCCLPTIAPCAQALGRLSATASGNAAVQSIATEAAGKPWLADVLTRIAEADEGRNSILESEIISHIHSWLEDSNVGVLTCALVLISSLSKGTERCRQAVEVFLPKMGPMMSDTSVHVRGREAAAAVVADFAKAGASGLNALKEGGVFGCLVAAMRASHLMEEQEMTCIKPCAEALRRSLTVDATAIVGKKVVAELVALLPPPGSDMLSFVAQNARFASAVITALGPGFDENYDLQAGAAAMEVVCSEDGFHRLLALLQSQDEWWRLRRDTISDVTSAFLSIGDAPSGMSLTREAGVLDIILQQLQTCSGSEVANYVAVLQNFSMAEADEYRDAVVASNALTSMVQFLDIGPAADMPTFSLVATVISLLVHYGTSAHRAAIRDAGAVEVLVRWSSPAWWYDSDTASRIHCMLGHYVSVVPEVGTVITQMVAQLQIASLAKVTQLLPQLMELVRGAFEDVGEQPALFDLVPGLLNLLRSELYRGSWPDVLAVLITLARIDLNPVLPAAIECAEIVRDGIERREPEEEAAQLLSVLAAASRKAKATIGSTAYKMLEESDIDNGHALVVVKTLTGMAFRPHGVSVAMEADVIKKASQVMASTQSRDLQEATLQLLVQLCEHSDASRSAVRDADLIPVVVGLLTAGLRQTADNEVGSQAIRLLLVLSESEALHLALLRSSPLKPLADICEKDSANRSFALRVISNLYCGGMDVEDKGNGGRNPADPSRSRIEYSRVQELLSLHHIEVEVATSVTGAIRDLKCGDGPRNLQSILASVRSLTTNTELRAKLVNAGISTSLVQVLVTEGSVRDGLNAFDLALACDCIRRCAYSVELRPAISAAGAVQALEQAKARGKDLGGEGGFQLSQAATSAIAALNGSLDLPGIATLARNANLGALNKSTEGNHDMDKLEQLPHFNTFISHKRSDAQDFARSLHTVLVGQGFTCFLDVDNLEELHDLEMFVAGVDLLIFVLTDHIFESHWCLKELAAAVMAGVPVLLITKEGASWEHQSATSPFPPDEVIQTLEPAACRQAFTNKALSHNNEYFSSFVSKLVSKVQQAVDANSAAYPPTPDGRTSGQQAALVQRRRLVQARSAAALLASDEASRAAMPAQSSDESSSRELHRLARAGLPSGRIDEIIDPPVQQMMPVSVARDKKPTRKIYQHSIVAPETSVMSPEEEVRLLREQVRQLMEQREGKSAPPRALDKITCCVFYCCFSRVHPDV